LPGRAPRILGVYGRHDGDSDFDPTLAADRSGTTDAHSRREGDADGVALAVMQNLAQKIDDKGDRIDAIEAALGINAAADQREVTDA